MTAPLYPDSPPLKLNVTQLLEDLKRDEGIRFTPYNDGAGNPTIGIGHNINALPLPGYIKSYLQQNGQITMPMVMDLFGRDLAIAVGELCHNLPWWADLTEARQRALVNMTWNLGIGSAKKGTGLLGFEHFLSYLENGEYDRAAHELVASKWWTEVGDRAHRISDLILTG